MYLGLSLFGQYQTSKCQIRNNMAIGYHYFCRYDRTNVNDRPHIPTKHHLTILQDITNKWYGLRGWLLTGNKVYYSYVTLQKL